MEYITTKDLMMLYIISCNKSTFSPFRVRFQGRLTRDVYFLAYGNVQGMSRVLE